MSAAQQPVGGRSAAHQPVGGRSADRALDSTGRSMASVAGPAAVLTAALLASEGLYLLISRLDAVNGWYSVGSFLALFASLFGCLAAAHAAARKSGARTLPVIVAGAVLFRLTLLPAGLPPGSDVRAGLTADARGQRVAYERFLLFDSDVWRYLWEGHVSAHGLDPFTHAPESPALDHLGDAEPGPSTDGRAVWSDVRDNVNHPHLRTIYPPLAHLAFRLTHALAPGSVLAFKALMTLADLAAGVFVALALRAAGRPVTDVLLYLWNPLVVKVFAGSGHVDALLVLALAAMAYAAVRGFRTGLAVAFGLAILAKLSPLVLVPLVARRIGVGGLLLALGIVLAGHAPFADAGLALFTSLAAFGREWEFNAGPFRLLRAALAPFLADADAAARVVGAAIAVVAAFAVARRAGRYPGSFAGAAAWTLGALLLLSPVVMPWYVTWLLPFAVLAGQPYWLVLSGLVGFAFLVMVDGKENPAVLAAEYTLFAAAVAYAQRDRLRAALVPGGATMKSLGLVCVVTLLGAVPTAGAQGSGSTAGSIPGSFSMVREVDGTLVSVDRADQAEAVITVDDKKTGERLTFKTDPKIKLRADSKSALGGRRELKLADFPAAHPVRVTYRTTDRVAVELKLKKNEP